MISMCAKNELFKMKTTDAWTVTFYCLKNTEPSFLHTLRQQELPGILKHIISVVPKTNTNYFTLYLNENMMNFLFQLSELI